MTKLINNPVRLDLIANLKRYWREGVLCSLLLLPYPGLAYGEQADSPLGKSGELSTYLENAQHALSIDHLTTPPDDNAVAYIEQALSIAPNNAQANDLLQRVIKRYEELVDEYVIRASKLLNRNPQQLARTYRDRAHGVITKHGLDDAELQRMDRMLAEQRSAISSGDETPLAQGDFSERVVDKLLAGHTLLGESALANGDLETADWHAAEAGALERLYMRSSDRLNSLRQSIASKKEEQGGTTRSYAGPHEETTALVKEIIACRIELGEHALEQGNVREAQQQARVAEGYATHYGVEESRVRRFSERVDHTLLGLDGWSRSKLFGNF
jgi:hypothetical protein